MSGRVDQTRIWAVAVGLLHPPEKLINPFAFGASSPPAQAYSAAEALCSNGCPCTAVLQITTLRATM
jgi:hypothetical protein